MTPNYTYQEDFSLRHNNAEAADIAAMLKTIGVDSLETLIQQTVPEKIRLAQGLRLPEPKSEFAFLRDFKAVMGQNQIFKSHIGLGYSDTIVPTVILRNILENPSWYTAYTPYQAEIAQGRLEMLLNYQTMIIDLTGMELANASL
jgi:glycine dehydrogenase